MKRRRRAKPPSLERQLLTYFENKVQGLTGIPLNIHTGGELRVQSGCARRLLDAVDCDFVRAMEIVDIWAESERSVRHYATLCNVLRFVGRLSYEARSRRLEQEAERAPYLRGKRNTQEEDDYMRRRGSGDDV